MIFRVLTIFPEMFVPFWEYGVVGKAVKNHKIIASAVNLRDFASGKHRMTDDRPFGGGCGMVMKPEPLAAALDHEKSKSPRLRTVFLTPQGRPFGQSLARELASLPGMILICGRYEGIDERIRQDLVDDEISIGDYILTGGEVAAMTVMDAVVRLIPGVLGGDESVEKESFSRDRLEHGHYTRPRRFKGNPVPDVLLSGNHREIEKWRVKTSLIRTFLKRKDLLSKNKLSKEETAILKTWCLDIEEIIRTQSLYGSDTSSGSQ